MKHCLNYFSLLFLFFCSPLFSQSTRSFENISTADGLSDNNVRSIVKDAQGFLWVGTYDGLSRYDGNTFDVFRQESGNDMGLPDNQINVLFVDSKDNLWIGNKNEGLALFKPKDKTFLNWVHDPNNPKSLSGNFVRSIWEDELGQIWIATENNTLSKLIFEEPNGVMDTTAISFKNYPYKEDIDIRIYYIAENEKGILYLSTSKGLLLFNTTDERFGKLFKGLDNTTRENLMVNGIQSETVSLDANTVLVGSFSGIYEISLPNGETIPAQLGKEYTSKLNQTNTIFKDSKNNIWIGSNEGLLVYDTTLDESVFYEQDISGQGSIGGNDINTIYEDNTGIIWIGTLSGGISKYDPSKIKFPLQYPEINRSSDQKQRSFKTAYRSKDGHDWISINNDLFEYADQKLVNTFNAGDDDFSLSLGGTTGIVELDNGDMMIGKWGTGLNRLNRKTKKNLKYGFSHLEGKNNTESLSCCITDMIIDDQQVIWLSTVYGYLQRFDPNTSNLETFKIGDWIWELFLDHENQKIYLATESGMVSFDVETKEKVHFVSDENDPNSISSNRTWSVFKDSKDRIWVGSNKGIEQFDPKTKEFTLFTDVASSRFIVYRILEDDNGFLWLGTQEGISKFDPVEEKFVHFTIDDGAYPEAKWAYKNPEGNFFFGGENGFNYFDPTSISINTQAPPVVITDFKVFNESLEIKKGTPLENAIEVTDKITLPYKSNSFSITFAALNFSSPSKNNYAYMLEGFDKDWVYNGVDRNANYTNLDPGEYTFKVKASNNDLVWNNEGAALQLIITPPFWDTLVFKGLLVLSILGLISLFFNLRYRRIKIKKAILENLVKKRTTELEVLNTYLEEQKEQILTKNIKLNGMAVALSKASKMQTNFFTGISHELRTPLTLIIAPLEGLIEETGHLPRINKSIRLAAKSSNALLRLVDQLLNISKIDSGFMKLQLVEANIENHVEQIFNAFTPKASELKIDYKFQSNLKNANCYFDGDKIEKILSNLINNALRFTKANDLVHVILEGEYKNNSLEYITIVVKDNGCGIRKEELVGIFDLFKQGTQSKQDFGKSGWGVGLYVVKSLTVLHNGEVNVDSKIDEGTTFSCRIGVQKSMFPDHEPVEKYVNTKHLAPVTYAVNDAIEKFPLQEITVAAKNKLNSILLVEDNEDLRTFIAEELSFYYDIVTASDGEAGLKKCRDVLPDLVISDVMMPKMDGLELCKHIKAGSDTCHITTILLTAKATQDDEVAGLNEGADDYITKPFNIKALKLKIDNLLKTRISLQQRFSDGGFNVKLFKGDERDKELLNTCISIIEKSISDPDLDAHFITNEMSISRSLLYSKLKSLTGQSVNTLIRNIRLKKASELILHDWEKSMASVSTETGFQNQSHFNRSFKDKYGMSPKEYRKSKTKDL